MAPPHHALAACALLLLAGLLAGCAAPTQTSPPSNPSPSPPQGNGTAPTYAPLPPGTQGPPIDPAKGYVVQPIRDGLYWVSDGSYQTIFLTTGQGVIVVDAPPSMGPKLLSAIREVTTEDVTHVIYSHSHADHIAAASMYPANATYIAHAAVARALAGQNTSDRAAPFGAFVGGAPVPVPTVTFEDNHTLTVGNQTLRLDHAGPAHEGGNLFVFAPRQRVLMLVDVVFPGWVPFMELGLTEDVPAFVRAHDRALAYEFDTFVGGHLARIGTRQDVATAREYVLDVRAKAAQALQSVDFNAVAQRTGFSNLWALFGTYLDEVAQECARLVVPAWTGRLAGADVFTEGHCLAMAESLRID